MQTVLKSYLQSIKNIFESGDAREESFYSALEKLIYQIAKNFNKPNTKITIAPKKTEAGNPDFRIWDGAFDIFGYVEAKFPTADLDKIEATEQLKRYRSTFDNLILTNFYEFRLYRKGQLIEKALIARPFITTELGRIPPIENIEKFLKLWELFFDFKFPKTFTAQSLAIELAKRTGFLKQIILKEELEQNPNSEIHSFYKAFKDNLLKGLTYEQFADLYAQTITYGLFAARSRANSNFNRELAFKFIPQSIGILHSVFKYISLGELSAQMQIIIDEISQILKTADLKQILQQFYKQGKGEDPILHFYETFLAEYDPYIRERRGVYYTPEPVVKFIVNAVNCILKEDFKLSEGLANEQVKLLDPAAGTLTFPAKAIEVAVKEHIQKWGKGDLKNWIEKHILQNFYAFELMMASYAIGHLKIGFILDELSFHLSDNQRFKLYLTNSLELEDIKQIDLPILKNLSQESNAAGKIKRNEKILVILGNPPYNVHSENSNKWTENLLKKDIIEGVKIQSYYKVDGKKLEEKNPKMLQDDYVKFLRFAQWKIQQAQSGIVAMITNHGYLDNPTFRGMRQSLMKTFDQIYIINLHGNSLKKEKAPNGKKDENVFDIRQGVAIAIFVKHNKKHKKCDIYYKDLWGLREQKFDWLENHNLKNIDFQKLNPQKPWYLFYPFESDKLSKYNKWLKITEIFPINSVGIVSSRDKLAIGFTKEELVNKLRLFANLNIEDDFIRKTFEINDTGTWNLRKAREEFAKIKNFETLIKPILYRPFDTRFIWYFNSKILIDRLRWNIMKNFIVGDNLAIIGARQTTKQNILPAFISKTLIDAHSVTNAVSISYVFPLYIYAEVEKKDLFTSKRKNQAKKVNLNNKLLEKINKTYNTKTSAEDILYYVYAILYSNKYRTTYKEILRIDFPRIPFTADYELFAKISKLGKKLADLHLLESELLNNTIVKFEGEGDNLTVEKIKYDQKNNRIFINPKKYFTNISSEVWNYYIGGYQVVSKWLKDRKNRSLSSDDIKQFIKIVSALYYTIDLQKDIDKLYPKVEENLLDF